MAILIRLFLLAVLLLGTDAARAETGEGLQLQEQEIKAGLLYNFLKYIDWPQSSVPAATITVCIYGDDPFGSRLQPMEGRSVNHRQIAVRTVSNISQAGDCQLLYVGGEEKDQWPQLQKSLGGKSILTVGDEANFAASGGMIEFGRKDNHISVTLNGDAVAAAHLHVDERLLKLVTVVHPGGP